MKLRLGVISLLLLLIGLLWLTTPASPWGTEGFFQAPPTARYIELKHTVPACINLGELRVYSYRGGPNLITPSTSVTKSSSYAQGGGEGKYLVDRNVSSILHTACNGQDIPSIQVDLGKSIPIQAIHAVNRVDCCRNRVIGLILTLLDENKRPVYVSEPVKSKQGKSEYVDTPAEYTDLTNKYPATLTWYPPQPVPVWDEKDEADVSLNTTCRTLHTPFDEDGNGNAVYLDRQNVECGPNETMKRFRLVREWGPSGPTGKYRYDYECCQSRAPQAPPPPPNPFQEAIPGKVASLESEVKRIQMELSRSAAPPLREDIVPQNRQSQASAVASSLGRQSNLLREIQQAVRNELYSARAHDTLAEGGDEECSS